MFISPWNLDVGAGHLDSGNSGYAPTQAMTGFLIVAVIRSWQRN